MAIITDKIIKLINYRIQQEEMSYRLYKSMAIYLDYSGFSGAAKLWNKYAQEELEHADWAYNYLLGLNIKPEVPELNSPQKEFKGLPNIIALSYKHEKEIMEQCQELSMACLEEGDMATFNLAQKYVAEQVDELKKSNFWVDRLEAFGDSKEALRLLDNEMAKAE